MTTKHLVVGIVAGLSLFTACSQATPAAAPSATFSGSASASATPVASESAPPSETASGSTQDLTPDGFMNPVMDAQAGVKTYRIDMTMQTVIADKATAVVMKGAVDQTDATKVNMSMDMEFAGTQMKLLKVDGDMFMQLGASGKKWMKVPKSQMAQMDDATSSTDMAAGLEKARSAIRKITYVGDEPIDGTTTRHYVLTMDSAGLSQMTGSKTTIKADTFDYDLWLDQANLVRKVSMDVTGEVEGKEVPMKLNGAMGNYDEPVSITAPAKADIIGG